MPDPGTIPELIRRNRSSFGERTSVVADGVATTYRERTERSAALASRLLRYGCGKGTRIGILFPNGIDWVVAFDAATRIGAVAVPINTFSTARELGWVLRHADVDTLLMCPAYRNHRYLERLETVAPGLSKSDRSGLAVPELPYLRRVLVAGAELPAWCDSFEPGASVSLGVDEARMLSEIEAEVTPADLAVVIYTSGSTSTPKGVVHTQGAILRRSRQVSDSMELRAEDRFYTNMPLFWVGGLMIGMLGTSHAGAALHCSSRNDAAELLGILRDESITRMTLFAPPISALRQHPDFRAEHFTGLRELREPPAGGALGMTETFGMHSLYPPAVEPVPGGMGVATPGIERRIVDPDTGAEVPDGESGELWVRGALLMDGYYKRERSDVFEPDGWFRTGDQCRLREGHIFWEGRRDEMIKSAGANVAPAEVEMVLLTFPDVRTAAVVGVEDEVRGQHVVAVVEAVQGAEVSIPELFERLRGQLASYKIPAEIIVLRGDEIPRSATGKVLKPKLLELLAARTGPS